MVSPCTLIGGLFCFVSSCLLERAVLYPGKVEEVFFLYRKFKSVSLPDLKVLKAVQI